MYLSMAPLETNLIPIIQVGAATFNTEYLFYLSTYTSQNVIYIDTWPLLL